MMLSIPTPTLPVRGAADFPVRRIYCVGRNYRAHALEMGSNPDREQPFYFLKPQDAAVRAGGTIPYPPMTADFHHELELVVALKAGGRNIAAADAASHILGFAVGIDLTRRDLQMEARKAGRPWDMGKGFDQSAPCGPISRIEDVGLMTGGAMWLAVDGAVRQSSDISLMIWNVVEIIVDLSKYGELCPGDLIFTGTPEGVGPLQPGQSVKAKIERLADLDITIGKQAQPS